MGALDSIRLSCQGRQETVQGSPAMAMRSAAVRPQQRAPFSAGGAPPPVVRPSPALAQRRAPVRCSATETTTTNASTAAQQEAPQVNPNACKRCGLDLSKKPAGCDGEGRVVGGLGAMPGMSWWPIKAYMPCPGLSQAGLEYVRKGQATNEMLFGGVSLGQGGAKSLDAMKEQADKGIDIQ